MVVGFLPLAMVSCADDSDDSKNQADASSNTAKSSSESAKPSPTGAESADKGTDDKDSQLETVAAVSFKDPNRDGYHFNVGEPGAGTECFSYDADFTCIAKAPESVPNLEDMPGKPYAPFTGRPGAFSLNQGGMKWAMVEGLPPATARLGVGQRVELENGTCEVPDKNTFSCTIQGQSFTMQLPERTVTTTAPDLTGGSGNGGSNAGGAGTGAGSGNQAKGSPAKAKCPYPMMNENPQPGSYVHNYCDGEWAVSGKYGTDGVGVQHFNGSQWEIIDKDGEYSSGMGPCYTEELLRKKGAPEALIAKAPMCGR